MRALVIALAAFAAVAPAAAQAPRPLTADDDLKCAAWAAVVIGINKDKPEIVSRMTAGLSWFLARYEGATGKPFEQGLTADYINRVAPDLGKVEEGCKAQMTSLGTRLQAWGQTLQAANQKPSGK